MCWDRGISSALRVLPERTTFDVQVQVRASASRATPRWKSLADARSNRKGHRDLPALDARTQGEYLIRLDSPRGERYFVKVLVWP